MNRLLYVLLISAISIIGFTMYKQNDLGQVSFNFSGFSFETNLVVFIATVLSFIFIILLINQSWLFVKSAWNTIKDNRKNQLQAKARTSLTTGLIDYAEGRFEQAEKVLLQQINHSDNKFMVYLSAARAAQKINEHERRDEYLRKALLETPGADIAIALTKAELQLAHDQNEQALATLKQLNKLAPGHAYVLTLLANAYTHLQEWNDLEDILPALKQHKVLSKESLLSFEITACNGQLSDLAKQHDSNLLIDLWQKTAPHLKSLPQVVEFYARQLLFTDEADEAEAVLRLYLDNNWHENTILLYSELDVQADNKQLEMVEGWLDAHQHNANLLLALGKKCISMSLWGKARNYLEASIAINPMPENYLKLARLLEEHMNEPVAAQEHYRHGLHLLADDRGNEILQKTADNINSDTSQLKIVKA